MKKQLLITSLLLIGSQVSLNAMEKPCPMVRDFCPISDELRTIKREEKLKAIAIINKVDAYLEHENEKIRKAAEKAIKRANRILSFLDWNLLDRTKTQDQVIQEIEKRAQKAQKAERTVHQLINQYQLQNPIAETKVS